MKKMFTMITVVVVLLAMSYVPAQAQTNMSVGFKGGLNFANIADDAMDDLETRTGVVGGVSLAFPMGTAMTIQPEFNYSSKGAKVDEFGTTVTFKFNYLEIPLLFKYNIPASGTMTPSLYAGPSIGILLSAKAGAEDLEVDVKEFFKSTDFGLMFGGGIGMAMGSGTLTFDARYSLGMSNISEFEGDDTKNKAFTAMVGYVFQLGN